jgi:hypothetical protein
MIVLQGVYKLNSDICLDELQKKYFLKNMIFVAHCAFIDSI